MTRDKSPTDPAPPVKEPPKDDPSGGPKPNNDIKEPQLDPKKIVKKPNNDPIGDESLPHELKDLNSV